jgi:exodeoxyribonuclease VII large subunit
MDAINEPRARETWLSVSSVTSLFNEILETGFPVLRFEGEIGQLQKAQSGHMYFSLKDDKSQVSAVMWAGTARALTFRPEAGLMVRCVGKPNVYGPTGRLQVIVTTMTPAGEGELQRRFEELKKRLEKEGIFSPARKRPLPFFPRAVGLVTSSTGAVLHDMMVKFRERMPGMPVFLAETRVQGEGAAEEIAAAIDLMANSGEVDVIIVARGGGSLQDLWSFNEEAVVRAVYRSCVPVVSGVGHEVDVTLCDLAADVRAPTPTAAAEMVVPKRSDLLAMLEDYQRRLERTDRWMLVKVQRVDELSMRLAAAQSRSLEEAKFRLAAGEARLRGIQPQRVIDTVRAKVSAFEARLSFAVQRRIDSSRAGFEQLSGRLLAMDPARVLERGYAMVEREGTLLSEAAALRRDDIVTIRFRDGRTPVKVIS